MFVNAFLSSVVFTLLYHIFLIILFGSEITDDYYGFIIVYVISLLLYLVLGVPLTFYTFWIYKGIKHAMLKQILIQITLLIFASLMMYAFLLRGLERENIDVWGSLGITYL